MSARIPAGRVSLTAEQRAQLSWKLRADGLTSAEVADAVWSLSTWFPVATSKAPPRARRHFERMAATASELLALLERERPLWSTAGIDWLVLERHLEQLAASATVEAGASPSAGRPRLAWRDQLIALVRDAYPQRMLESRGGRARLLETALLVLQLAGVEGVDEREIRRVLKRAPVAPFKIHRE